MGTMKLPAVSKHPDGTASFYLRVAFLDGGMWEVCTETPQPIPKLIASMEEYLTILRDAAKRHDEAHADATPATPERP